VYRHSQTVNRAALVNGTNMTKLQFIHTKADKE